MTIYIPRSAEEYGFVTDGLGTHSSRTMMFSELSLLLADCPPYATLDDYREEIIENNILLKQTESTRNKSFRHLRELYGLDVSCRFFRALRDLWCEDAEVQAQLAVLCATSRDPSLRSTASVILNAPQGSSITPQMLAKAAEEAYPTLNQSTLAKIGRNTASTWTQSGHLNGRSNKKRSIITSHPTSVAYALFISYLTGVRGSALFSTFWCQLLDAPIHTLHNQASVASQHGWLEYRHSGDVTDISFRYFLRENHTEGNYE